MKLSIHFFHTKISHEYPNTTLTCSAHQDATFSSLGIITKDMRISQEILYVDLLPAETVDYVKGASIVTTESRASLFKNCNLIVVPNGVDLSKIIDFISGIFTYYFDWADAIYETIAKNMDLQTIIDLSVPIIGNPMYIADSSFKMLAKWGSDFAEVNPTWSYQEKFHYLPYQVMQNLIESGELERIQKHSDAWLIKKSKGFTALPYISKSIQKEGIHYGNFFIIEYYHALDDCDLELADYLGKVISTAIYGNLNYLETSTLYNAHFLADVIEGTLTDRQLMVDQLRALGWKIEDDYVLALFNTREDNDAIQQHMMALMTNDLKAQCLSYRGEVLAILNDSTTRKERIVKRLGQVARDFNRTVAVSEQFCRFDRLGCFYGQARFVLDKADDESRKGQIISYESVFVDQLAELVGDVLPPCTSAEKLKAHDANHHTEYCKTLLTWLMHERNTVRTAEVMYIHRNTLKNRLERIEEIITVDLDDYANRQRLLLSLLSDR